jgi:D-glycero-alpha-D-manno-heptose-7-phosphate kinase
MISKRQLARDAIHVEQNIIKENVGSQDQVAVAFGGFNKIEFGGEKDFYVYPVTIENGKLNAFQDHLMLFFTGFSRNASDIAEEQIKNTVNKKYELRTMQEMVDRAIEILNGNINDIKEFGKLLHESWLLKKSLTKLITTSSIDEIYDAARKVGAVGGKLLGAGGGGFMLLFVPPEKQQQVKNKLKDILYVPIRFENLGSQVVLYSTQDFS